MAYVTVRRPMSHIKQKDRHVQTDRHDYYIEHLVAYLISEVLGPLTNVAFGPLARLIKGDLR
jgi:hypothetical protein